jgi:hydrogenase maturation protein HypF
VPEDIVRLKAVVRGAVQGVGFRPFVYRLATGLSLDGWVGNDPRGVHLEVEGPRGALDVFLRRLQEERPPRASIQGLEFSFLDPRGFEGFVIRGSRGGEAPTTLVLPDIVPCPDCLRELFDPGNRRHRHPFINCTNCGPRFSVVTALPYDRPNTTMAGFPLCPACRAEYEDPGNRRFHAQPVCCPDCGPRLEWRDREGRPLAHREEALRTAVRIVREGGILALKGLGGYQLVCDARSSGSVRTLRERKRREEKPFALLAGGLEEARRLCETGFLEERLLSSPEGPIVLLRRRKGADVAGEVAPGNPHLGVMLPSTPLHHLLAREWGFPVVATSGNVSDEPLARDEREAVERLAGIADGFLVHDRPIARRVDDSVARVVLGREQVLRRARGYAPLPVALPSEAPAVLATGAHLKNTVAFAVGRDVFVSQHVGDLETAAAQDAFRAVTEDLSTLYRFVPRVAACDLHPDYIPTRHAKTLGLPGVAVQHHLAHALACAAENEVEPPFLAATWDGTGLGTDGTVWGGEFLLVTEKGWERAGHLRGFRLPGGDQAIREPRRCALGVLHALKGKEAGDLMASAFTPEERMVLVTSLERDLNSPRTSSMGRLFDAVASLLGIRQKNAFEGQAAMELEFAAWKGAPDASYPVHIENTCKGFIFDWEPIILGALQDRGSGRSVPDIARAFHATLAAGLAEMAKLTGSSRVMLTGGVFQNRLLTELTVEALRAAGMKPYWHQRIPPNDGGISLGQVIEAQRQQNSTA